jgi:hypothetical protein
METPQVTPQEELIKNQSSNNPSTENEEECDCSNRKPSGEKKKNQGFLTFLETMGISESRANELVNMVKVAHEGHKTIDKSVKELTEQLSGNELAFSCFSMGRVHEKMHSNPLMGLLSAFSRR